MSDDRLKSLAAALGASRAACSSSRPGSGDAETGVLASWVQQCSFEPPQLSLCLRRGRDLNAWLEVGAAFAVNILEDDGGTGPDRPLRPRLRPGRAGLRGLGGGPAGRRAAGAARGVGLFGVPRRRPARGRRPRTVHRRRHGRGDARRRQTDDPRPQERPALLTAARRRLRPAQHDDRECKMEAVLFHADA